MTLSFDQSAPRDLDAMLIVYSLLDDHPASTACESFIRDHTNWFTTTLTLFEAKAILTKVYAVDTNLTSRQLSQFSAGPAVGATYPNRTEIVSEEPTERAYYFVLSAPHVVVNLPAMSTVRMSLAFMTVSTSSAVSARSYTANSSSKPL